MIWKAFLLTLSLAALGARAEAQDISLRVRTPIRLPDLPGYLTLKCDLHIHTVFSDGLVWPTVRVEEAWREGLDAIAITDHNTVMGCVALRRELEDLSLLERLGRIDDEERERLEEDLRFAVEKENYEEAARIRDRIRELDSAEEQ